MFGRGAKRRVRAGLGALAVSALAWGGGLALAQQPASGGGVVVMTGDAPFQVTVLGAVNAEIHQKSLFPKESNETLANAELKRQAAAMGADAVVKVVYEPYNAATSVKGFIAHGVAVKYVRAPAANVAAAAPAAAPAQAPQTFTQAAPAPAVGAAPASAPVAAGPRPAALIALSESEAIGQAYTRLGEVKAEAHQKSLFSKKPARALLDDQLRAEAARLGADAVVMVKYDMNSPMFSTEGSHATGVAIRFGSPPPPAPVSTAYAAPASAGSPALAAVGASPAAPAVAALPTMPGTVQLSEADAGRPYAILGQLNAEAHQAGARLLLEQQLREQAARLGADAVVQIRFDLTNGSAARGSHATGVAVKFK